MVDDSWPARARAFRDAHHGPPLVLPNAWDAGSAAIVAHAGAKAVATTSAGVSWSLGYRDGEQIPREVMAQAVRRIVRVVDVPVSADIEAGYGPAPEDVAATVTALLDAGVVGVNVEDSRAPGGPLFGIEAQCDRIRAARQAAAAAGCAALFVNARIDVYLFGIGEPAGRLQETIRRAQAYAAAGADGIFVPWAFDPGVLKEVVAAVALPVNASAAAGGPGVAALADAGVRRISLGSGLAQTALAGAFATAHDALHLGTFDRMADAVDFDAMNALLPAVPRLTDRDGGRGNTPDAAS